MPIEAQFRTLMADARVQYAFLTVACVFGIQLLKRLHLEHVGNWSVLVLFVSLIAIVLFSISLRRFAHTSSYLWLCICYAGLVGGVGLLHWLGLVDIPGSTIINAQGVPAQAVLKSEASYTLAYLFFPIMVLAQMAMIKRMDFRWVTRIILASVAVSAAVAIYQRFGESAFFYPTSWKWDGRYGGLAIDPNALALAIFLTIPMLAIGYRLERNQLVRIGCLLLFALLAVAEWATKSRTSAAGIVCFVFFLFLLMMWHQRERGSRIRFSISLGVAMALGAIWFFSHAVHVGALGGSVGRLITTWHEYQDGGVAGVFSNGEPRHVLFRQASELIERSPLAGWGPGGFYREHANLLYQLHGSSAHMLHDNPLNHYLMIACDFGIPIMLLNLFLLLVPLYLGLAVLRRSGDANQRFVSAVLIAANVIFLLMINTMPPSYFLGVLWVWTAQLALLILMAEGYGIRLGIPASTTGRYTALTVMAFVTLLILAGAYHTAFGADGYKARLTSPWWVKSIENTKG